MRSFLEKAEGRLLEIEGGGGGAWRVNENGVERILALLDRKAEFIVFKERILVYVKSALGHPAMYPLADIDFQAPAAAVLMDLDGTTAKSEHFWIWILEKTVAALIGSPRFSFVSEDMPYLSGHSVSEHLQYCLEKYSPRCTLEEARSMHMRIARQELSEIRLGSGRQGAFSPAPGLKEFLLRLKARKVKLGLVSSGLHEKAFPEILSVFDSLQLGNPLDFYDAVITAGQSIRKGQMGTLGELSAKPHPWLYAEALRVGLGIPPDQYHRVVGIEDSSAGVLSIRLAGFAAVGLNGGNIRSSGADVLVHGQFDSLIEALPFILGDG